MINSYLCEHNGVFVKDTDTGEVIFCHNARRPFASASIIKLFILSYYLDKDMDETLSVSSRDRIGGVVAETKLKTLSVSDALVYMISFSDNTATNLLIKKAGFEEINRHIRSLGCQDTVLARKMLDYKARESGLENKTSLFDCCTVMERLMQNDFARFALQTHKCRERLDRYIYGGCKTYLKCGDLNNVYNDVGIIITPEGKRMFAGVLSEDYDKTYAKRLCGLTGLLACGRQTPLVWRD